MSIVRLIKYLLLKKSAGHFIWAMNKKNEAALYHGGSLQGFLPAFSKLIEWKSDTLHYAVDQNDINELGLQLLYAGNFDKHIELALEVLRLNMLLFPDGFDTYYSYGQALAYWKKEEAIAMYKKPLELNPKKPWREKSIGEVNERIKTGNMVPGFITKKKTHMKIIDRLFLERYYH